MNEALALIQRLLEDNRKAQETGNAILHDLRVDVAALTRSHEAQGQTLADMRAQIRNMDDRLREVEQRVHPLSTLEQRHAALEGRVRQLEGDERETKVVRGAFMGFVSGFWRAAAGPIVAALIAAASVAAALGKVGGTPG